MSKKRPLAPPPSPTDEWGIYDPAKAGMQALYSRLGRPVLRASAESERRKHKRGFRPERPADGVGLAIQEARRRADARAGQPQPPPPETVTAPPPEPPPIAAVAAERDDSKRVRAKAPKGARKKAAAAKAAVPAPREIPTPKPVEPLPAVVDEPPAPRRGARKATRSRTAAPAPAKPATPPPAVPPPSPRRPRGPVPLAAWAHAVIDSPRPEPKRSEGKGLWRGIFRIPSEVALVEYGRGCRIHRLVIEAAPDSAGDLF